MKRNLWKSTLDFLALAAVMAIMAVFAVMMLLYAAGTGFRPDRDIFVRDDRQKRKE